MDLYPESRTLNPESASFIAREKQVDALGALHQVPSSATFRIPSCLFALILDTKINPGQGAIP